VVTKHFVDGNPIKPPFPAGLDLAPTRNTVAYADFRNGICIAHWQHAQIFIRVFGDSRSPFSFLPQSARSLPLFAPRSGAARTRLRIMKARGFRA
jgi:hypothetical protein